MISIVIPTRNEQGNVTTIVREIRHSLACYEHEIIFVDDSTDDTPAELAKLARSYNQLTYIHRSADQGIPGLAGAVIEGFRIVHGDIVVVMDADLQHPPALLPYLVEEIRSGHDVAVAIRTSKDTGFDKKRKFASMTAAGLAKFLTGARKTRDPMSGYFAIRREALGILHDLRPVGWKILLEILCRRPGLVAVDVPYTFQDRGDGQTKFRLKTQLEYGFHLFRLGSQERWIRYGAIGAAGTFANLAIMALLFKALSPLAASLVAGWAAIVFNFSLNDSITWGSRARSASQAEHAARGILYSLVSIAGVVTTTGIMVALHHTGIPGLVGQLIGICCTAVWTYQVHHRVTFAPWHVRKEATA